MLSLYPKTTTRIQSFSKKVQLRWRYFSEYSQESFRKTLPPQGDAGQLFQGLKDRSKSKLNLIIFYQIFATQLF